MAQSKRERWLAPRWFRRTISVGAQQEFLECSSSCGGLRFCLSTVWPRFDSSPPHILPHYSLSAPNGCWIGFALSSGFTFVCRSLRWLCQAFNLPRICSVKRTGSFACALTLIPFEKCLTYRNTYPTLLVHNLKKCTLKFFRLNVNPTYRGPTYRYTPVPASFFPCNVQYSIRLNATPKPVYRHIPYKVRREHDADMNPNVHLLYLTLQDGQQLGDLFDKHLCPSTKNIMNIVIMNITVQAQNIVTHCACLWLLELPMDRSDMRQTRLTK